MLDDLLEQRILRALKKNKKLFNKLETQRVHHSEAVTFINAYLRNIKDHIEEIDDVNEQSKKKLVLTVVYITTLMNESLEVQNKFFAQFRSGKVKEALKKFMIGIIGYSGDGDVWGERIEKEMQEKWFYMAIMSNEYNFTEYVIDQLKLKKKFTVGYITQRSRS